MMWTELLRDIASYLPALITGVGGWFMGRGRTKAEIEQIRTQTDTTEIENSGRIVDMYKSAIKDMEDRHRLKHDELTILYEQKISQLKEEIAFHEKKAIQERELYDKKIKLLEEENGILKLQNENYKKELKSLRETK